MNINEISAQINVNAHEKGFWKNGIDIPEKLMLIVSEIAEAMEADRKERRADIFHYKEYLKRLANDTALCEHLGITDPFEAAFSRHIKDTFEDELADAVIRIFDLAVEMGVKLEFHIKLKHMYNKSRPYLHVKKY